MKITNAWLMKCRSPAGGWTYAQFAVLGLSAPPTSGWKERLIGRDISEETARQFKEASRIKIPQKKAKRHAVSQQQVESVKFQYIEAFLKETLTDRRGLFFKDGEFVIMDRNGPQCFGDRLSDLIDEWVANEECVAGNE